MPGHVWGRDDRLGTLNLITPERIRSASHLVTSSAVFPLNLPLDQPNPLLFNREALRHTVLEFDRNTRDDKLDQFYPQASSQRDSLRRVRYGRHGFYGGREDAAAAAELGIDALAERGIVGRGVLVDIARWRDEQRRPLDLTADDRITPADLDGALAAQRVVLEDGNILLVRTGWLGWYLAPPAPDADRNDSHPTTPGLEGTAEMAAWI